MSDRPISSEPAFPIVISGPSGVGKTSLVDRLLLLDRRCIRSVSATTRAPREREKDGESYFFVGEAEFLERRSRGDLAESAVYNGAWYGTPRSFLEGKVAGGLCVILTIEVQGGMQVRSIYPEAVLVFVVPPSWEELAHRLLSRGTEDASAVDKRIRRGREETAELLAYDYVVVNDSLDRCAENLAAIVRAERRRRARLTAEALRTGTGAGSPVQSPEGRRER